MPEQAYRKGGGEQEAARGKGQLAAQVRPAHRQRELAPHLHHRGREDSEKDRRKDFLRPDQGSPGALFLKIYVQSYTTRYPFEITLQFFCLAIYVA